MAAGESWAGRGPLFLLLGSVVLLLGAAEAAPDYVFLTNDCKLSTKPTAPGAANGPCAKAVVLPYKQHWLVLRFKSKTALDFATAAPGKPTDSPLVFSTVHHKFGEYGGGGGGTDRTCHGDSTTQNNQFQFYSTTYLGYCSAE